MTKKNKLHIASVQEDVLVDWLFQKINKEAIRLEKTPITTWGFALKDAQETLWGGISGFLFFGALHIDQIYVDPSLRRRGWGKTLLKKAEMEAIKQGAGFITLQTMSWQAPHFYTKMGYEVEFKRQGYPQKGKMFFFKKVLKNRH